MATEDSLMKTLYLSMSAALAVAAIAYSLAIYGIEEIKQESFMMKACVDAGGDWSRGWGNRPVCARPERKAK